MIDLKVVLAIILMHWLADFVFQTDKMAKGKSKNWEDLLEHTLCYSVIWLIIGTFYSIYLGDYWNGVYFALITFIAHTITDYFTSKINKYYWDKKDPHNFFVSVGFDQWLHAVQLLLTFKFLIK